MRLISCYVENFGGLHQFSYTFTDGLNILHQQNGWGKTTFAVFVKAMLYGLEYSPRKKLEDNERKRYMPWQGGAFGGNLVFETGGKTYRAERFFGTRDKDDTFRLYDVETGLESADFSDRLGEELFHVDSASYAKSTYIPQNSTQAGVTDHLRARLGNIIENANDMERSTEAIANLTERQKEYKRTGKRGRIYEIESRISELEHGIAACDNKEAAMAQLEGQIAETKVHKNKLLEKKEYLEQQVTEELKHREEQNALELKRREEQNALELKQQSLRAKMESLEQLRQQILQNRAAEEQLQRIWTREQEELETEQETLQGQQAQRDVLQAKREHTVKQTQRSSGGESGLWKIAGGILIAIGILMQVWIALHFSHGAPAGLFFLAIGCMVLGILALIFGFRRDAMQKQLRKDSAREQAELERQWRQMQEVCRELQERSKKRRQGMQELWQQIQALKDAQADLQQKQERLRTETEELKRQEEYLVAKIDVQTAEIKEQDGDVGRADAEIFQTEGSKLEQLQKQRRELEEQIRICERNLVEYRRDVDACMTVLDERQDLEGELAQCREQKAQMQYNFHILQQTVKWLEKAKEQFASYYMGPLAEGFQKYARIICGEDADEIERMQMDIGLDVRMEAGGILREKEYFSVGYRDFIGVCTRLALTDALFGEEKPFLILDDPFVNLDDEKMKRAGKLLKELADTYQVIYLVCHSGRY